MDFGQSLLFDWFNNAKPEFEAFLTQHREKKVDFLQIGVYSGSASVWLLNNVLTHPESRLFDVDHWQNLDGDNFYPPLGDIESTYDQRTSSFSNVVKHKMFSDHFFRNNTEKFDFIYIDGDHHRDQVFRDSENAIKVAKSGCIIAFDDYLWDMEPEPENKPKDAIDVFLSKYSDRIEILHSSYQVWVRVHDE